MPITNFISYPTAADLRVVAGLVPDGATRVLDLGCGDGALLTICGARRGRKAVASNAARRACWPVCGAASACARATCRKGWPTIPTAASTCVILSQTLQYLDDPT
jgi:hypothetical protein